MESPLETIEALKEQGPKIGTWCLRRQSTRPTYPLYLYDHVGVRVEVVFHPEIEGRIGVHVQERVAWIDIRRIGSLHTALFGTMTALQNGLRAEKITVSYTKGE